MYVFFYEKVKLIKMTKWRLNNGKVATKEMAYAIPN